MNTGSIELTTPLTIDPANQKDKPVTKTVDSNGPFRMPNAVKISGKSSSITNSFINALIPVVKPTTDEVLEALTILEMSPETICCAYCGGPYSEWDHLRPLVMNKQPTGFISEIHNLLPACQKCNQSKGNRNWRTWMFGTAKQSPASRGIADLDDRAERIAAYEAWQAPTIVDFQAIVGSDTWDAHWNHHEAIIQAMREAQTLAERMRVKIAASYLALTRAETAEVDDSEVGLDEQARPAASGRTTYIVALKNGETPPLSKRDAVLALVMALAGAGVLCESMSIVTGRSALRSVDGIAAGGMLWDTFADEHGQRPEQRKLWFLDKPIHQDGRTWVLANNRWGPAAEDTMTDLVRIGPDIISYRRSGDTGTITRGVETEW